jgi:MFS family permease
LVLDKLSHRTWLWRVARVHRLVSRRAVSQPVTLAGDFQNVGMMELFIMLMTLAQIGGIALGAALGDRFEKRLICAACMLLHMAGLLCLTYATGAAMVVAFALLHGAAWGLRGPFMQAIRAEYFGVTAIGMILGLSFMIIVVGQVGGPMIAGGLADLTGNYRAGFTVLALLAGVGSLFFLVARKPARPRG